MADTRLSLLMMIVTACGMAGMLLVITHIFGRVKLTNVDRTPYECGMKPYERIDRQRFSIHFYLVAMLFILFDIEAAFLWPWAATFRSFAENKFFALGEMGVFLGILVVGFVYVWQRGALEWD